MKDLYFFKRDTSGKSKNWVFLLRLFPTQKALRICWHDKNRSTSGMDAGIKIGEGRLHICKTKVEGDE